MRMWWERPAESFDKTCPCFIRLCGGLSPPRPKQLGKFSLKCHQRKCLSGNVCARACSFRSLKLLTMMVRVFSVPYRPHWLLTPSQPHMVLVWSQLCHCKGEGLFPPQGWVWWADGTVTGVCQAADAQQESRTPLHWFIVAIFHGIGFACRKLLLSMQRNGRVQLHIRKVFLCCNK